MRPEENIRFAPVPAVLKGDRRIMLRPLGPDDGEALAEFYASIPRHDYRFYSPHPLTRAEAFKAVERHAVSETSVCIVGVEERGQIAGYAWVEWGGPESEAGVFGICVRPEFQGGGMGQALMGRLLEAAHGLGPARISLTVQAANPRALALYRKMGFAVVREQMRAAFEEFPAEPEYHMERAVRHGPGLSTASAALRC